MPDLSSMFSLTTDKYKRSDKEEKEENEEIDIPQKFDLSSLVSMSR